MSSWASGRALLGFRRCATGCAAHSITDVIFAGSGPLNCYVPGQDPLRGERAPVISSGMPTLRNRLGLRNAGGCAARKPKSGGLHYILWSGAPRPLHFVVLALLTDKTTRDTLHTWKLRRPGNKAKGSCPHRGTVIYRGAILLNMCTS